MPVLSYRKIISQEEQIVSAMGISNSSSQVTPTKIKGLIYVLFVLVF